MQVHQRFLKHDDCRSRTPINTGNGSEIYRHCNFTSWDSKFDVWSFVIYILLKAICNVFMDCIHVMVLQSTWFIRLTLADISEFIFPNVETERMRKWIKPRLEDWVLKSQLKLFWWIMLIRALSRKFSS